jgi:hypothetical protein
VGSLQSRHAVAEAQGQFGNRKEESPLEDNTRGFVLNVLNDIIKSESLGFWTLFIVRN